MVVMIATYAAVVIIMLMIVMMMMTSIIILAMSTMIVAVSNLRPPAMVLIVHDHISITLQLYSDLPVNEL